MTPEDKAILDLCHGIHWRAADIERAVNELPAVRRQVEDLRREVEGLTREVARLPGLVTALTFACDNLGDELEAEVNRPAEVQRDALRRVVSELRRVRVEALGARR